LLDTEQSAAIAEHVAACPHCAEELGLLEATVACG
jgi:anti-sigma factor RsiW